MNIRRFSLVVTLLLIVIAMIAGAPFSGVRAATVCSPASAISGAFTKDGAGDFCWQTTSLCTYINSWNVTTLEVNGVAYTNVYVVSSSITPLNGMYTIHYNSAVAWGHFEIAGTCSGAGPTPTHTVGASNTPITGASPTRTPTQGSGPTPTRTSTQPAITPTRTATPGTGGGPAVDPALRAICTGTSPITCHFGSRFPAGNYNVTVVLGGSSAGNTSVQAEARRNILGSISTAAGTLSTQTFTVNVREPEGQPTGQGGTGTPGLDLYFTGSAPLLNGIGIAPAANPFVIYLAGDSTVCDQPTVPYTGWGQILPQYFKMGTSIANYGDSGENSSSFLSAAALFPTMKALVKTNDFVLIQFGHNDKDTSKATYQANLISMINGVRQRGGTPVLVTPPVRRLFGSDGKLTATALHINNLGVDLPAAMREVAAANNVPLIDLTAKSKVLIEGLGSTGSASIYLTVANDGVSDNTHFSAYGAGQMANLVLQGIRELNLSIVSRLR